MKRLIITVSVFILAQFTMAVDLDISDRMPATNNQIITGYEQSSANQPYPSSNNPLLILETVGTTYYEFQTNGSPGDRIVYHDDGTIHICWTKLLGWPYPPAPRGVYYNWRDQAGNWAGEMQVSQNDPAGYCQMDEIYDTRVAISYHETGGADPTFITLAIEWDPPGMGFFDHFDPPDEVYPQNPDSPGRLYWPYIAVDRNDVIHIVASENTDRRLQRMAYTRSTDGGATWLGLQLIDTVMVIGSAMDASPVSDKVVIAYCAPRDTTSQWQNDIVYYESLDGLTWDWRYGQHNITDYDNDDDSLWAYTDCDILIDYNDDVHLVWNAQRISGTSVYYKTYLFHYCDDTGEITEITHHPESLFADICGVWNRPVCKMSLAASSIYPDLIATTWTQFDTADVSATGFGNGEIYMSYSTDGGASWYPPRNLTETHTPNCYPGECESDHWSSLADIISGPESTFHLTYINDKDAGFALQDEGAPTLNNVLYLYELITDIPENDNRPTAFQLNQNYPNPFNASTTISFNLDKPSRARIEIFDITGARVDEILNGKFMPGLHKVNWDAEPYASGVYFYRLETDYHSETRQAILIK